MMFNMSLPRSTILQHVLMWMFLKSVIHGSYVEPFVEEGKAFSMNCTWFNMSFKEWKIYWFKDNTQLASISQSEVNFKPISYNRKDFEDNQDTRSILEPSLYNRRGFEENQNIYSILTILNVTRNERNKVYYCQAYPKSGGLETPILGTWKMSRTFHAPTMTPKCNVELQDGQTILLSLDTTKVFPNITCKAFTIYNGAKTKLNNSFEYNETESQGYYDVKCWTIIFLHQSGDYKFCFHVKINGRFQELNINCTQNITISPTPALRIYTDSFFDTCSEDHNLMTVFCEPLWWSTPEYPSISLFIDGKEKFNNSNQSSALKDGTNITSFTFKTDQSWKGVKLTCRTKNKVSDIVSNVQEIKCIQKPTAIVNQGSKMDNETKVVKEENITNDNSSPPSSSTNSDIWNISISASFIVFVAISGLIAIILFWKIKCASRKSKSSPLTKLDEHNKVPLDKAKFKSSGRFYINSKCWGFKTRKTISEGLYSVVDITAEKFLDNPESDSIPSTRISHQDNGVSLHNVRPNHPHRRPPPDPPQHSPTGSFTSLTKEGSRLKAADTFPEEDLLVQRMVPTDAEDVKCLSHGELPPLPPKPLLAKNRKYAQDIPVYARDNNHHHRSPLFHQTSFQSLPFNVRDDDFNVQTNNLHKDWDFDSSHSTCLCAVPDSTHINDLSTVPEPMSTVFAEPELPGPPKPCGKYFRSTDTPYSEEYVFSLSPHTANVEQEQGPDLISTCNSTYNNIKPSSKQLSRDWPPPPYRARKKRTRKSKSPKTSHYENSKISPCVHEKYTLIYASKNEAQVDIHCALNTTNAEIFDLMDESSHINHSSCEHIYTPINAAKRKGEVDKYCTLNTTNAEQFDQRDYSCPTNHSSCPHLIDDMSDVLDVNLSHKNLDSDPCFSASDTSIVTVVKANGHDQGSVS